MIHSALLKLITSVHQKHPRTGKRKRRQATNQKVFKTNLSHKIFVFRTYRESLQIRGRQPSEKNKEQILQRGCTNNKYIKRCSTSMSSDKWILKPPWLMS